MKLVLGLLCSLFFLQGWSQTSEECLKIHQQWMKEHMPSPASLSDEELVRQASDAVYSLAYEPENIALIRAAGKFDPSLADYAAFKELRTPSLFFITFIPALNGSVVTLASEAHAPCK
mgnify:CR=1 FL=1